ncbi:hypothetical protein BC941DRAFT_469680 [Chlamydoabsidia padenii]|nr:hypothetical protein BC941DRAFT_469680 [Chlamydoabsidia padenii]
MVVIVLVIQITLGVLIQQQEENPFRYMAQQWHDRGDNFRNHLQYEFQCCGYANVFDDTVISDICPSQMHFMALLNGLTMLCLLRRQQLRIQTPKRDPTVIPLDDTPNGEPASTSSSPPRIFPFTPVYYKNDEEEYGSRAERFQQSQS